MEDWSTDFIQSDTTYMVLKSLRKPGPALNRVQVRMLAASSVPHVLDLHVREVDEEAELHYNIGGKKMLSSSLKTERMSLVEYYALLLQIATALEYGMTYMLSPNGFVLREEYMFMDGPLSAGNVYLTYMPLQEMPETGSVRERLGRLAARWMTTIENLQGSGVQRILQMCEQQTFSLQAFKELLVGLLTESGRQAAASEMPSAAMNMIRQAGQGEAPLYADALRERAVERASSHRSREREFQDRPSAASLWGADPNEDLQARFQEEEPAGNNRRAKGLGKGSGQAEAGERAVGSPKTRKKTAQDQAAESVSTNPEDQGAEQEAENKNGRLVVPLLSLLGLVVLWRFLYMDQPSKMSLLICTVATPLMLAAAYLGWSGKLKLGRGKAERLQEAEEAEALATAWGNEREPSGQRPLYEEMEAGIQARSRRESSSEFSREPEPTNKPDAGRMFSPSLRPVYGEVGTNERAYERTGGSAERYGYSAQPEEPYDRASCVMGTGLLGARASQPTVMLDEARKGEAIGGQAAASRTRYRLERVEKGTLPTDIPLPHGSFTIGRSDEVAQHVEESPGISRAHVEIELSNEQCLIRDIGSRNGTILNEETMIPYKAYELHEGDTFKIAGIVYTMRCG